MAMKKLIGAFLVGSIFFAGLVYAGLSGGISTPVLFDVNSGDYVSPGGTPTTTVNQVNMFDWTGLGAGTSTIWTLGIGTSSPFFSTGVCILCVYGTSTIQTPLNTQRAFQVLNAASSSIFQVDTQNSVIGIGTSTPSQNEVSVSSSGTSTVYGHSTSNTQGGCLQLESPAGSVFRLYATTSGLAIFETGSCK